MEKMQAQIIGNLRMEKKALEDKIQELEKMLSGNDGMSVEEIKAQFVDLHRDVLVARGHSAHLRQALEFYADETKYEKIEGYDGETEIYIERDCGEKARQALGAS
ncbi:hypothetical protein [Sporosarcina sp. FSL K6-1508]|uniref:hypothetical protein n=1 Tax=Sporosarcina sp. FSL K6-1508 TaxID=2921553 RepID=UPI0030FBFDE0